MPLGVCEPDTKLPKWIASPIFPFFGCSLQQRADKINEIAFLWRFVGNAEDGGDGQLADVGVFPSTFGGCHAPGRGGGNR